MASAEEKKLKVKFDTHVSLIMLTDELSKSSALFKAWVEGPQGLAKRLALMPAKGPEAPLEELPSKGK